MKLSVEKQEKDFKIAVMMDPVKILMKKDLVRCQLHILPKSVD